MRSSTVGHLQTDCGKNETIEDKNKVKLSWPNVDSLQKWYYGLHFSAKVGAGCNKMLKKGK